MKTILQVEDDENDVVFLKFAMKRAGVRNPIQVANDGRQAIDYLQGAGKFADRVKYPFPCLVLLDLKLPYVMGLEVLKWIRQQHGRPLPVVILTASLENADIAAAYRLGANAFLSKPSEAGRLQDMVKAINDFWLTHNTPPPESSPESPMEGVVSLVHTPAWSDSRMESAQLNVQAGSCRRAANTTRRQRLRDHPCRRVVTDRC